jgi:transketolase
MFRSIPNAVVFYPSDAVATENAVKLAANYNGIVFVKGGRNDHPLLYPNEEEFRIGGSKYIRKSEEDRLTIVSGGPPLFEAIKAADRLKSEGINCRIVDLFCVKPVDKDLLTEAVKATNGLIYVVEDCYYEGNLGETVAYALKSENTRMYHRAVDRVPRSGTASDLYDMFGLSADKIYAEIKDIVSKN